MKISLLFPAFFFLFSCEGQTVSNEILIEGQVKNIPDGKLYLVKTRSGKDPVDSTICTNGHFVFKINTDSSFIPCAAAIRFPDSSKPTNIWSIFFRNHMHGEDSMNGGGDGFYLEKGYIKIEGDNKGNPSPRIFAGKETDIMLEKEFTNFGHIGNVDSSTRLQKISFFKKEIEKYPFSYFLLQSIYDSKEQYSTKEANEILSLFNSDVQKSKLSDQFKTYLTNKPEPNKPYPNLSLLNATNQRSLIIDSNSKLTMLVFWASWCVPCRMEIPVLKEIQNKYKEKGLKLVSISIDNNKNDWMKALDQEQMPWAQYIVDRNKIDLIKQQFDFTSIPLVVFTDYTGKKIVRFMDYDKDAKKIYEEVIQRFIK